MTQMETPMTEASASWMESLAQWVRRALSSPGDEDDAWRMARMLNQGHPLMPGDHPHLSDLVDAFEATEKEDTDIHNTA